MHKKGTLAKVPERVREEEAATLGTGLITAAVALFAFFKLPFAKLQDDGLSEKLHKVKIAEDRSESDWIL